MEPVAHDMLAPRLRLDYDPDSKTRGVDDIAPVLTPPYYPAWWATFVHSRSQKYPHSPSHLRQGMALGLVGGYLLNWRHRAHLTRQA